MLKKFAYTLLLLLPGSVLANQPKDWQLGFQKSASQGMDDIVWFHDYMLLPVITAIMVFVLFLIGYTCIRYRASRNKVASTTSHNTTVEVEVASQSRVVDHAMGRSGVRMSEVDTATDYHSLREKGCDNNHWRLQLQICNCLCI